MTYRAPISEQFPHERVPWRAIAAELRYAVTHDMDPGEPVGSIDELARMYAVNRKTARKALVALAAEGLIEAVPGRRYRVPGEPGQAPPVSALSVARQRAASAAAVAAVGDDPSLRP